MNLKNQRDIDQLTRVAVKAALRAGEAILDIYGTDFSVEIKEDKSPLTEADKNAHHIIKSFLDTYEFPILSEEGREIPYETRKGWETFWLVDPLDGTKEFIKRNGEFTVNIALIHQHQPILGVVFPPVLRDLYFAGPGWGTRKCSVELNKDGQFELPVLQEAVKLPLTDQERPYTVVGSRSHASPETEGFIRELRKSHPDIVFASKGSSLKLCLVAEGLADVYPRLAPTMEWDTGAGHALVVYSGGTVNRHDDGKPLEYNKRNLLNPWFIATGGQIHL